MYPDWDLKKFFGSALNEECCSSTAFSRRFPSPLGVPLIQFDAPDGVKEADQARSRRKTQRWVRGLRDCARMARQLDGVRPVSVMDREADFFELFDVCRQLGTVDLLVRTRHNRRVGPGQKTPKLFDGLRAAKPQARTARVALRWRRLRLPPPSKGPLKGCEPVDMSVVHVREEPAPAGAEPLEWFLLTSLEVRGERDADRLLEWYRLRWRIEDWHRVLKSGCKVTDLGLRRSDRIERAATIKAVIA